MKVGAYTKHINVLYVVMSILSILVASMFYVMDKNNKLYDNDVKTNQLYSELPALQGSINKLSNTVDKLNVMVSNIRSSTDETRKKADVINAMQAEMKGIKNSLASETKSHDHFIDRVDADNRAQRIVDAINRNTASLNLLYIKESQ